MAITDLGGGNIRKCFVQKWADFSGYGFNLHAEKGKAGQYIGKVDEGGPAEAAGLKEGDRIVEVNDVNIGNENHQQVVTRIKSEPNSVWLLVVDKDGDEYCKNNKIVITPEIEEVKLIKCPDNRVAEVSAANEEGSEASTAEVNEVPADNDYETPADLPPVTSEAVSSTHSDDEDEDLPPPPPELSELDDAVNSVNAETPEPETSPLSDSTASEKVVANDAQTVEEPPNVVTSTAAAPSTDGSKASDNVVPKMSAAEMREALAKNKRQDPRVSKKISASDKLRMFQNL